MLDAWRRTLSLAEDDKPQNTIRSKTYVSRKKNMTNGRPLAILLLWKYYQRRKERKESAGSADDRLPLEKRFSYRIPLSVLSLAQDCSLSDDLARESLVTRQNSPRQNGLVKIAPTKQLARVQHSQGKNIQLNSAHAKCIGKTNYIFSIITCRSIWTMTTIFIWRGFDWHFDWRFIGIVNWNTNSISIS